MTCFLVLVCYGFEMGTSIEFYLSASIGKVFFIL